MLRYFALLLSLLSKAQPCSSAILRQDLSIGDSPTSDAKKGYVNISFPKGEDMPSAEGGHIVVPEQVNQWTQSRIPKRVQLLIAGGWLLLFSSIPVILGVVDREGSTKSQVGIGVMMVVTILGGFVLFTNTILFQSAHFGTEIRSLTSMECIYLMAQIISTVGYGDITPAKERGQVCVALYVISSIFFISLLFTKFVEHIEKAVHKYRHSMADAVSNSGDPAGASADHILAAIVGKPQTPSLAQFLRALAVFAVFDVTFILFYHFYPGEEKTWLQATYMSLITLSTVGFGAVTPVTEEGMIFGAFWMLFGSAALVSVIGEFSTYMSEWSAYEHFDPQAGEHNLEQLKQSLQGEMVSEGEFLRFAVLSKGLAEAEDFGRMLSAFHTLRNEHGVVDAKDLMTSFKKLQS